MPGQGDAGIQLARIDVTNTPTPTVRTQLAEEVAPRAELVSDTPASPAEEVEQLTLVRLPPAAVLPDNQELDAPVTDDQGTAEALDPVIDVSESNEQLVENLSADPSDYTVASNNTVEVQASETLGHFADWLGIRAWDVRRLNNMAFRDPVIVGKRLTLNFSGVNIAEFELQRREFHSTLQQEFFSSYRIQGVEQYEIKRNDNVGAIARNRYSTPIWLVRQYNPELDFNRIQIGQQIAFPLVEQAE